MDLSKPGDPPNRRRRRAAACALILGVLPLAAAASDPFGVSSRRFEHGGAQFVETRFTVPPGHYLYADALSIEAPGTTLIPERQPEPIVKEDPFTGQPVRVYAESFSVWHRIVSPAVGPIKLTIRWRGCNEQSCFLPQEKNQTLALGEPLVQGQVVPPFSEPPPEPGSGSESAAGAVRPPWERWLDQYEERGRVSGYQSVSSFLAFLDRAEGTSAATAPKRGMGWTLLLIFLGGAALNLTPCVLPMIPVHLAIMGAGRRASSRWRGLLVGGVYGLAMALTYGALGVFVVLTGSRFGILNASPVFNGVVAAVFLVLALAMFDVFHLDFTRLQPRTAAPHRVSGVPLAFFMGMVSALLAGACVAPVVIGVIVLAGEWYASGRPGALALPFVLGVGMGLPWPLVGAGLSSLPKPGAWMNRVKYALGVLILGLAAYYAWAAIRGARVAAELRGGAPEKEGRSSSETGDPQGDALADALRRGIEEGKPVVVDFWATWCKNCLAMDRTTLADATVRARLEKVIFVKYRAEQPGRSPAKEVLDRFHVIGLPTYVWLAPSGVGTARGEAKSR